MEGARLWCALKVARLAALAVVGLCVRIDCTHGDPNVRGHGKAGSIWVVTWKRLELESDGDQIKG